MDKEQALRDIQNNMSKGNMDLARAQISELYQSADDAYTSVTCLSLLKVIGDKDVTKTILSSIPEKCADSQSTKYQVSKALYSLGFASDADLLVSDVPDSEDVLRLKMEISYATGRFDEVIEAHSRLESPTIDDDVRMIDALASLKEYDKALSLVDGLLEECKDYNVLRCKTSCLVLANRIKDAEKFVRSSAKQDKDSADGPALMAHMMWLLGKSSPAGAFASKAVKEDPKHIPAMEILGYCLVEKGKYDQARIVAGAINEVEPGHPAVSRILDMM